MKTFLILGGGTGGTIMANKLVKRLDPQEWKIVIVDKSEIHYYQPGFLFIPFGMYKPEDVVERKKSYLPSSVQFIQSEIEKITPEENEVTLKGGQVLHYDTLLIASGTDIHPEEIEGMLDGGWYQNIFDFYTFEGTTKLAKFLEKFNGGRVVINVAEMPIKCPVAPWNLRSWQTITLSVGASAARWNSSMPHRSPAPSPNPAHPQRLAACLIRKAFIWNPISPSAAWIHHGMCSARSTVGN